MNTISSSRARGQVVVLALVVTTFLLVSIGSLINYITLGARSERHAITSAQALALAEAGVDEAVYSLNQNGSYSGETNSSLPDGTFITSVSTVNGVTKHITSTGYVPDATNPVATHTVQATATINASVVSFNSGVQVGDGGLTMNNGSKVIGNIASNGPVSGSGSVTNTVSVAGPQQAKIDQQWTTQNSSFNVGDMSTHDAVAQSFKPSFSGLLTQVNLYLKKTGTPGDLSILIVANNAGYPGTTLLGSGTIASTSIASSYAFLSSQLFSPVALTADQSYWIIASSSSADSGDYAIWGLDQSGSYSAGSPVYSNSWNVIPIWNPIPGDLDFQTYMRAYGSISGISVGGNAYAHSLSNCTVSGNAYYQSISSCTVSGATNPGSADPSPGSLPISNAQISQWEQLASAGTVIPGPYSISGTKALGPAKINGDLNVTGTLKLTGIVWVNGNVTFSNNAALTVDASTGNDGAILIADATGNMATKGTVNFSNNVIISGNGNAGSYPMVVSTNSGSNAISLSNNATGVILFANNGTINVSNNASANQLTGYAINLNNNSTITYVNGLQSATFTNGPGGSWAYVRGTYAITQ